MVCLREVSVLKLEGPPGHDDWSKGCSAGVSGSCRDGKTLLCGYLLSRLRRFSLHILRSMCFSKKTKQNKEKENQKTKPCTAWEHTLFYFAACLLLVLFWTLCCFDPKKRTTWSITVRPRSCWGRRSWTLWECERRAQGRAGAGRGGRSGGEQAVYTSSQVSHWPAAGSPCASSVSSAAILRVRTVSRLTLNAWNAPCARTRMRGSVLTMMTGLSADFVSNFSSLPFAPPAGGFIL